MGAWHREGGGTALEKGPSPATWHKDILTNTKKCPPSPTGPHPLVSNIQTTTVQSRLSAVIMSLESVGISWGSGMRDCSGHQLCRCLCPSSTSCIRCLPPAPAHS
jgi:hypothetical protein